MFMFMVMGKVVVVVGCCGGDVEGRGGGGHSGRGGVDGGRGGGGHDHGGYYSGGRGGDHGGSRGDARGVGHGPVEKGGDGRVGYCGGSL